MTVNYSKDLPNHDLGATWVIQCWLHIDELFAALILVVIVGVRQNSRVRICA